MPHGNCDDGNGYPICYTACPVADTTIDIWTDISLATENINIIAIRCIGCAACVPACPESAITMKTITT